MANVVPFNRGTRPAERNGRDQSPAEVVVLPRVNFQQLLNSWAGGGGHNHVKPHTVNKTNGG